MSIPDSVTTSVVAAGIVKLAGEIENAIAAMYGHPGESIGTILGNIGERRRGNLESVTRRSALTLLNIGVKAQEVPLPLLGPILEGGSLHGESSPLHETWANLLANAADPRKVTQIEPSFASILKALGPREVRFLDFLSKDAGLVNDIIMEQSGLITVYVNAGLADKSFQWPPTSDRPLAVYAPPAGFELMLGILDTLGLLKPTSNFGATEYNLSAISADGIEQRHIHQPYLFALTPLARAFVRACQPPSP
jgi:hypothetical protein